MKPSGFAASLSILSQVERIRHAGRLPVRQDPLSPHLPSHCGPAALLRSLVSRRCHAPCRRSPVLIAFGGHEMNMKLDRAVRRYAPLVMLVASEGGMQKGKRVADAGLSPVASLQAPLLTCDPGGELAGGESAGGAVQFGRHAHDSREQSARGSSS